ncbi:hypothetical protein ACO2Q3_26215 [Caulobacter sp. KR2-114]|uniref:hypothetical protein n=1 Tax=Caulobacter sp. KR2-114 TaxID=3400912 RepID=UPI003C0BEEF0
MFSLSRLLPMNPERVDALASRLEEQLGAEDAVRAIRQQITVADRKGRERLYMLHDEIARRHHWWLPDRTSPLP